MTRVLVDSASEDLREVLRELLELEGYSVVRAAGRDERLPADVDLLLVDVASGPDYEALVRRLRERCPGLKVVTLGVSTDPAARGDEALDHPIRSADDVLRTVRRALEPRP